MEFDGVSSNGDDAVSFENRDYRVLPVSLALGKSIPSSLYPSEHPYRPGYGEELVAGSDERLIYQAALEVFLITFCRLLDFSRKNS